MLIMHYLVSITFANAFCTTSGQVIIPNQDDSKVIHIVSAEMWKCPDGDKSIIQCPTSIADYPFGCQEEALWIPNVLSLVQFWYMHIINGDNAYISSLIDWLVVQVPKQEIVQVRPANDLVSI